MRALLAVVSSLAVAFKPPAPSRSGARREGQPLCHEGKPFCRGRALFVLAPPHPLGLKAHPREAREIFASPRPRPKPQRVTAPAMALRVPWKNVFIAEYAGPIVVFPLVLRAAGAPLAQAATYLWTLHFGKRLLETLFVHSFSKSTMPLANLFKNCGYYWGAAGLVAWDIARVGARWDPTFVALWAAAEGLNYYTHAHLASLRADGSREAKVPTAWPFARVCSPNYSFEILSWVFFTAATRSPAAAAFTLVGAAQMAQWSRDKLKRYRRKFSGDDAFTATHALVPGVF